MQAKLITTFTPLGEPNFAAKVGTIVNALRNNPHFPEPWLPQVGSHADLEAAYNTYLLAFQAAANGDRARIHERDFARAALSERLRKLAGYLELIADGDTAKLMGTGYDLRKDIVRSTDTSPAPAPDGFTVKHGGLSGHVILHATRVAGAKSYEAQHTDGDPHDEAAWHSVGVFTSCNKLEIDGLTPAKTYWFRLRAIDSNGNGAWTDPASLMVV
jgi:hypothetical protein